MANWVNVVLKIRDYSKPLGLLYKLGLLEDMDILSNILLKKIEPYEIEEIKKHIMRNPKRLKDYIDNGKPNVENFIKYQIAINSEKVGGTKYKRKSKYSRKRKTRSKKKSRKNRRTRK